MADESKNDTPPHGPMIVRNAVLSLLCLAAAATLSALARLQHAPQLWAGAGGFLLASLTVWADSGRGTDLAAVVAAAVNARAEAQGAARSGLDGELLPLRALAPTGRPQNHVPPREAPPLAPILPEQPRPSACSQSSALTPVSVDGGSVEDAVCRADSSLNGVAVRS